MKESQDNKLSFEDPFVFISYAKEDRQKALEIFRRLDKLNLKPWMDKHHLRVGDDWQSVIPTMIKSAKFFLLLLSTNATNKRGFIQKEISEALKVVDQMPENQIFILPARLDECDVPSTLQKWQWIDLFKRGGRNRLEKEIVERLGNEYEPPVPQSSKRAVVKNDSATQRIRELLDRSGTFVNTGQKT